MSEPLPAQDTKHHQALAYPHRGHTFLLTQSSDGCSNGTALWLGAQVLSLYLAEHLKVPPGQTRPRAVELGSGVGLTALVLGALGYDVLATDTPHVCSTVLRHNIAANSPTPGLVQVRELDWNVPCDLWRWDDPLRVSEARPSDGDFTSTLLRPPFDLIASSDTLYDVSLVQPFFRTVHALAASSHEIAPRKPILFVLALERRDPQLIDQALAGASVRLVRVPTPKVRKALERGGVRWARSEWEGVEIWKGWL